MIFIYFCFITKFIFNVSFYFLCLHWQLSVYMENRKCQFHFKKGLLWIFLILSTSCIEPTEPVFKLRDGLLYVDAFVGTAEGVSYATIYKSVEVANTLEFEFINDASVSFHNLDTGEMVSLSESNNNYLPPWDFMASVGDSWELHISLADGTLYRSRAEAIKNPVAIKDMRATYDPELLFRESSGTFLPGHFISVDIEDPGDVNNFYFWKFRSFENLNICGTCTNQIYRDGGCTENEINIGYGYTVDYLCETDCWQIRYNENIKLFSDEFNNGNSVNNLPVADVLLYSKEDIVVEVQQFSLSAKAYDYYSILKDIVDNNSSLNAPPPATLIGNMFNPSNSEEQVLGRFTASAVTKRSLFIDRTNIPSGPIEPKDVADLENCFIICGGPCPTGPGPPCPLVTRVVCNESRYRTAIEPEGWIRE